MGLYGEISEMIHINYYNSKNILYIDPKNIGIIFIGFQEKNFENPSLFNNSNLKVKIFNVI